MIRLPSRIPVPLATRIKQTDPNNNNDGNDNGDNGNATPTPNPGGFYIPQGREVDCAIGGIPFLLATYPNEPQTIETIPVRKDQLDTEQDPGEQSLSGWWRRSQASFHEGAGLIYQEPNDGSSSNGFHDSRGVDVFTQGRFTLLRRMYQNPGTATYDNVRGLLLGGTSQVITAVDVSDGTFVFGAPDANLGPVAALAAPRDAIMTADGSTYSITDSAFAETVSGITTSWSLVNGGATALTWGKGRPWVIGGRNIWQPPLSGGDVQPTYEHPNAGWTYTCMAEGPGAMYFGGHDGNASAIQAVTFDESGGIPQLSGAAITATLPDGELVHQLSILGGTYFGIGTSRGFRIGTVNVYNNAIEYGPLVMAVGTPANVRACTALTSNGRYFLVAFDSDEGPVAYKVDTGTQFQDGTFPYARDIECGTAGHITSLAISANGLRVVATTDDGHLWYQSLTDYVDTGYLQSGRIRYRTTEKKSFKYLSMEIEPLKGGISADLLQEGGGTVSVGSLTEQGSIFIEEFAVNSAPLRYASVKLTLTCDANKTGAPVVNSYLLKALPAVAPQRMISLPLQCFDSETARSGQRYGGSSYAYDRLHALQILEDNAETITYQDFTTSTNTGRTVVIEAMKFQQNTPTPNAKSNSIGGIIYIQLRTVDA